MLHHNASKSQFANEQLVSSAILRGLGVEQKYNKKLQYDARINGVRKLEQRKTLVRNKVPVELPARKAECSVKYTTIPV